MIKHLIEFLISDVITATVISAIFMKISNSHADDLEKINDKSFVELKHHIDLKLEIMESHLKEFMKQNE